MRRAFVLAGLLVVSAALSACGTGPLLFVRNGSQANLVPKDYSTVQLPITLRWQDPGADRFAVFADQSPVPPGQTLLSLVAKGDPCRQQAVCPDQKWLSDHYISVTASHDLTVAALPNVGTAGEHTFNIVRIDSHGRRIDESSIVVTFFLTRGNGGRQ